jgi:hypothetical protein
MPESKAGLQMEGVFAYFMHLKCQKRFGDDVGDIRYIFTKQKFVFFIEVKGAAINSAYYGYPELCILRYPAHRCHAVTSPGFEPMTLWLRVRHPNHSATTLQIIFWGENDPPDTFYPPYYARIGLQMP